MELNIVQISPEQFSDLITKTINKAVKQALDDNRDKERLLTLKDTSQYLNLSIQTLYSYTSRKTIPYIKKGKKLLFRKKDLDEWLKEGHSQKYKRTFHEEF